MLGPSLGPWMGQQGGFAAAWRDYPAVPTLDLDFLYQDRSFAADFLDGVYQAWDDDPATAPRLGRWRSGSPGLQPLGAQLFGGLLNFQRASVAWCYGPDGVLKQVGPDQPRFDYDPVTKQPKGLLLEESRTNSIRNSIGAGAVPGTIGSGGQLPTNWQQNSATNGTLTVLGNASESGLPGIDLQIDASAAGNISFNFELPSGSPLTAGATHTGSLFARIVGGSTAGFTGVQLRLRTDAGTPANGPAVTDILPSLTTALARYQHQQTVAADATAGRLQLLVFFSGPGSLTLRLLCPQLEVGPYATSPIITTGAALTRAADNLTGALGPWFNAQAGTFVVEAMLPQLAPAGVFPELIELNDGTTQNRFIAYNNAGTANLRWESYIRGVSQGASLNNGPITAGSAFRFGVGFDDTGQIGCANGGASVTSARARPTGLTQLRIGSYIGGSSYANGWVRRIQYWPRKLSSAELVANTEWAVDLISASGTLDRSLTVSRASSGTYFDRNGVMRTAGNDVPRLDYDPVTRQFRGLLIEESRTNLLLNSATLATQTVTIAATPYTLSFWGTGTVTLSGAATGSLAGTGASNRVSLVVTPSAGALTLTVSGSVTWAQLEAGSFATSWIPTTTTPATRAADVVTVSNLAAQPWWNYGGFSFLAQLDCASFANFPQVFMVDNGVSPVDSIQVNLTAGGAARVQPFSGGSVTATALTANTGAVGISLKVAGALAPNDEALVLNPGSGAGAVATGTGGLSAVAPTTMTIGNWRTGSGNAINGHLTRLHLKGRRASNTELQQLAA